VPLRCRSFTLRQSTGGRRCSGETRGRKPHFTVTDGDLSDQETRDTLISGYCGDLAQALIEKLGPETEAYGVTVLGYDTEAQHLAKLRKTLELDFPFEHVVIRSRSNPDLYLDATGQKSLEELRAYWGGGTSLVKADQELLAAMKHEGAEQMKNFADAAIELDRNGVNYPYIPEQE
jgi:hypothetical protein